MAQYLTDSYPESNQDGYESIWSTFTISKVAQSFVGDGNYLESVKLYLATPLAETGNVYVELYAHTGTYGTSSTPTGSVLATSESLDISTLTSSFALVDFPFFINLQLGNGTNYCLAVYWDGGSTGHYLRVGHDSSSPAHGGNASRLVTSSSTWQTRSYDVCFYVYTNDVPPATTSTSTTSTSTTSTSSSTTTTTTTTSTSSSTSSSTSTTSTSSSTSKTTSTSITTSTTTTSTSSSSSTSTTSTSTSTTSTSSSTTLSATTSTSTTSTSSSTSTTSTSSSSTSTSTTSTSTSMTSTTTTLAYHFIVDKSEQFTKK